MSLTFFFWTNSKIRFHFKHTLFCYHLFLIISLFRTRNKRYQFVHQFHEYWRAIPWRSKDNIRNFVNQVTPTSFLNTSIGLQHSENSSRSMSERLCRTPQGRTRQIYQWWQYFCIDSPQIGMIPTEGLSIYMVGRCIAIHRILCYQLKNMKITIHHITLNYFY